MPGALVCLPTYNERENIEPMLRVLTELGMRVIVIDDASPDGTGELADRLAAELDGVSVLHRPHKDGLGPAYVAGFREALATDAEFVLELDCDFSHDPDLAPRLVEACAAGADLALGSRYVPGGGTRNWGLARRLVSRLGSLYARLVLGVGVHDLTGGFKCYRREALARLDLDAIRSRGYLFQIETTYHVLRGGGRVVEVPIVFYDRVLGTSKMSHGIVLEAILGVPRLRFRRG